MAGIAESRSASWQQSAITVTTPTGGYAKGTQVKQGNIIGYVADDFTVGQQAAIIYRDPAVLMEKVTGSGKTFAIGGNVYWDNSTGKVTNASTGNTLIGRAKEAATAAATQVLVDLSGSTAG